MATRPNLNLPEILIAEDEPVLLATLAYNLEREGFRVRQAEDGEDAWIALKESLPDLLLLDWMLPHVSGIDLCHRIRRSPDMARLPIILLTARGEEADRVRGLDAGADDYVAKPFGIKELIARVRAVLRRARPVLADEALSLGDIDMDLAQHRVTRGGRDLALGPTEFRLLRHFMEHPKRVWSRAQLLDAVWGSGAVLEERTVDVHIGRLRKELNAGGEVDPIRTVRASGYAFDTDD